MAMKVDKLPHVKMRAAFLNLPTLLCLDPAQSNLELLRGSWNLLRTKCRLMFLTSCSSHLGSFQFAGGGNDLHPLPVPLQLLRPEKPQSHRHVPREQLLFDSSLSTYGKLVFLGNQGRLWDKS